MSTSLVKKLTSQDKDGVSNRVDYSLQRRDARHPTMKVVIRAKVPTRQPHGNIIPHTKQPNDWKVCKRNHARPVGNVAK
jgi:hypothetical protein